MKLYVVTHRVDADYSSYEITDAIFSSKEYALHWIKNNRDDYYWIEEFECDQWLEDLPPIDPTHEVGPVYEADVYLRTGEITTYGQYEPRDSLRHPVDPEVEIRNVVHAYIRSPTSYDDARRHAARFYDEYLAAHFASLDRLYKRITGLFPDDVVVLFTNYEPGMSRTWLVTIKRPGGRDVVVEWSFDSHYRIASGPLVCERKTPDEVVQVLETLA